jgi:hypothetical protein
VNIHSIGDQSAVYREDGTTRLPDEYTTPANCTVDCMHCSTPIDGIPVPIAFSLDASRTPPVYKVGHFFHGGPCALGYILETHPGNPHMYAFTKQLLVDAYGHAVRYAEIST